MKQAVRVFGILNLITGGLMLVSPETTRKLVRARTEFAVLSDTAMRLLGAWLVLTGAISVASMLRPERLWRMREEVAREVGEGRRVA